MFACLGGLRYWPLTGDVGFLRAPLRKVARVLAPGTGWSRVEYPSLPDALAGAAPFAFRIEHTVLAVAAGEGQWTVVLDSAFPSGDIAGFFQARARLDLGCDFVAVQWIPRSEATDPSGRFDDYRYTRRRLLRRRSGPGDLRTVQVTSEGSGWTFDASGPVRDYERTEAYQRRRRADRLDRSMLHDYVQAAGIAVDDPGWAGGPVVCLSRTPAATPTAYWSTPEELRRLCGYPDDVIPGL